MQKKKTTQILHGRLANVHSRVFIPYAFAPEMFCTKHNINRVIGIQNGMHFLENRLTIIKKKIYIYSFTKNKKYFIHFQYLRLLATTLVNRNYLLTY